MDQGGDAAEFDAEGGVEQCENQGLEGSENPDGGGEV